MSEFDSEYETTIGLYTKVVTRLITQTSVFNNNRIDRVPIDHANSFDFGATVDIGNKKMTAFEENLFFMIFASVIVLGIFGNILVIWTVLFNKNMRTTNNLFVLNLAISDLTLCFFSIPFNVYKTLYHDWKFGDFLCRLAPFFQASNVFVSSMSITAIALDRFIRIVCVIKIHQNKSILRSYGTFLLLIFIWLFAFILSSPLFMFNKLHTLDLHNIEGMIHIGTEDDLTTVFSINNLPAFNQTEFTTQLDYASVPVDFKRILINHCVENWPYHSSRLIYSYTSMLIQYIMPIIIVGIAYGSIWCKLNKNRKRLKDHTRRTKQTLEIINDPEAHIKEPLSISKVFVSALRNKNRSLTSPNHNNSKARSSKNTSTKIELNRRRKMNVLLSCIALIFAASWLPLNLFNILSDTKLSIFKPDHFFYILNAVCILLGMSSAVSNPILYGLLNENFKREYVKLFSKFFKKIFICCGKKEVTVDRNNTNNIEMARSSNRVLLEVREGTMRDLHG